MQFECFTFFLNATYLPFQQKGRDKKDILSEVLSSSYEFDAYNTNFAYKFLQKKGNVIYAKFGKKRYTKIFKKAKDDFDQIDEETYPHCIMLISIDDDPKSGQRIAFEVSNVFNKTLFALELFIKEINKCFIDYGYTMSVNPIINIEEFWDTSRKYKGKIDKLSFDFLVPNLFAIKDTLNNDLSKIRDTYHATKASIEFENEKGNLLVPEEDNLLKQSVSYTSLGGGSYSFKIHGEKTVIKSGKKIRKAKIPNSEFDELKNEGNWEKLFKRIFGME